MPNDSIIGQHFRVIETLTSHFCLQLLVCEDIRNHQGVLVIGCHPTIFPKDTIHNACLSELQETLTLNHYNIAQPKEIINSPEFLGQVLPMIKGKSIFNRLNEGILYSFTETLSISQQLCSALDSLHLRDIHHGLVNTHLVFVDDEHRVFLLGVGFGTLIPAYLANPEKGIGFLPYFAPEYFKKPVATAQTDIFGTGAVLYELLTGIEAFGAGSPEDIIKRITTEIPSPPRAIDTRIPKLFNNILAKAIEKEPSQRFSNAGEFLHELKDKRLVKEIETSEFVEKKTKDQDLSDYLKRYDREDEMKQDQFSQALSEWKQPGESLSHIERQKLLQAQRRRHVTEDQSLAPEVEELFESKRLKPTGVKAVLHPIFRITPLRIFIFATILGVAIIFAAWKYNRGEFDPFAAFEPEPVDQMELLKTKLAAEKEERLEDMLIRAAWQFEEGRLTKPEGNNAYETYEHVLEEFPENEEAQKGLVEIVKQLRTNGFNAMSAKNYDKALDWFQQYIRFDQNDTVVLNQIDYIKKKQKTVTRRNNAFASQNRASDSTLTGRIYFAANGGIFSLDVESGKVYGFSTDAVNDPYVAPNGLKIVYTNKKHGSWELISSSLTGKNAKRLTKNLYDNRNPSWSPNGYEIIFASGRYASWDIFMIDANGNKEKQITNNTYDEDFPHISPNGRWFVYQAKQEDHWDIYKATLEGEEVTRLTAHSEDDLHPKWSPNGRYIAFESERSLNPDIYIMSASGTNKSKLYGGIAKDTFPIWAPDSRHVAFIHSGSEIKIVTLKGKVIKTFPTRMTGLTSLSWCK